MKVLYSFPHRLGASRICYTAWQQVNGLARAGAQVLARPSSIGRAVAPSVTVMPTLARGRLRLPYRVVGSLRAFALHDYVISRYVEAHAQEIDIVHGWPLGSLRTLKIAARLGIPTVLERPNAHTRFAYEVVRKECDCLGVALPKDHEHAWNDRILAIEEEEYRLATRLLCPSDFVAQSFLQYGYDRACLARHFYGVDERSFYPATGTRPDRPFTMIFVGVCAVRKGLHFALEAWLKSPASNAGRFLIAGDFLPEYKEKLRPLLAHPSVTILGHRNDVPELMRNSDVFVLPTIEEGFGLVCTEAMASGSVPLVSEVCTEMCRHMQTALVHPVGNVNALSTHISLLFQNRALLADLREAGLCAIPGITWAAAGRRLVEVYQEAIDAARAWMPNVQPEQLVPMSTSR